MKDYTKEFCENLTDDEYYNLSYAAYQSQSQQLVAQKAWIETELAQRLRHLMRTKENISVLTVGPGGGQVDVDILKEIAKQRESVRSKNGKVNGHVIHNQPMESRVTYHVIEKNPDAVEKFKETMSVTKHDFVDYQWYDGYFQDFLQSECCQENQGKFDLVIFVRVLYYIDCEFALKQTHEKLLSSAGMCLVVGESMQSAWPVVYELMGARMLEKWNGGSSMRPYHMEGWKDVAVQEGWRHEAIKKNYLFDCTPLFDENSGYGRVIIDFLFHERNAPEVLGAAVVKNVKDKLTELASRSEDHSITCCLGIVIIYKT